MYGDIILETAKTLGITALEVFVRCATAHQLRQAEVVAEDRHSEWQSSGLIPDYVTRWCNRKLADTEAPLFV